MTLAWGVAFDVSSSRPALAGQWLSSAQLLLWAVKHILQPSFGL